MNMEPTNELRFIQRGEQKILQQRWMEQWITRDGVLLKEPGAEIHSEWRDVPLMYVE